MSVLKLECPSCGGKIDNNSSFCSYCGSRIEIKKNKKKRNSYLFNYEKVLIIFSSSIVTNINDILTLCREEKINPNDIFGLEIYDNNLCSIEGLEVFENLCGINFRNNNIESISDKTISFLNERIYKMSRSISFSETLNKNSSEVTGYLFPIFLKFNNFEEKILSKLNIEKIPNEYVSYHLQKSFYGYLEFFLEKIKTSFFFSENSNKLKIKYSSLQYYLNAIIQKKEEIPDYNKYRDGKTNIFDPKEFSFVHWEEKITLITDLNPFKENLNSFSSDYYAYLSGGESRASKIYYKIIPIPKRDIMLKSFEEKYNIDLSFFKVNIKKEIPKRNKKWWRF